MSSGVPPLGLFPGHRGGYDAASTYGVQPGTQYSYLGNNSTMQSALPDVLWYGTGVSILIGNLVQLALCRVLNNWRIVPRARTQYVPRLGHSHPRSGVVRQHLRGSLCGLMLERRELVAHNVPGTCQSESMPFNPRLEPHVPVT